MEDWLNPAALGTIGTLITALVGAIILIFKEKRSAPIDRRSAELATTTAISSASKTTIDSAIALNDKLGQENTRVIKDLDYERHKVYLWERWYAVLVGQWDILKKTGSPPLAPSYTRRREE